MGEFSCGVASAPAWGLFFNPVEFVSRFRHHLTIYAQIAIAPGCSAGLFPGALPEKLLLKLRRKEQAALADNEGSVTISRTLILGCRIGIDVLPLS